MGICQQVPLPDCQGLLQKQWDKLLQKCSPSAIIVNELPPVAGKLVCELAQKGEQQAINEICQQVPLPDCQGLLQKKWDKLLQKCSPSAIIANELPPVVGNLVCELAQKGEQPAINEICQQVPLPDCQGLLQKKWDKL